MTALYEFIKEKYSDNKALIERVVRVVNANDDMTLFQTLIKERKYKLATQLIDDGYILRKDCASYSWKHPVF